MIYVRQKRLLEHFKKKLESENILKKFPKNKLVQMEPFTPYDYNLMHIYNLLLGWKCIFNVNKCKMYTYYLTLIKMRPMYGIWPHSSISHLKHLYFTTVQNEWFVVLGEILIKYSFEVYTFNSKHKFEWYSIELEKLFLYSTFWCIHSLFIFYHVERLKFLFFHINIRFYDLRAF